jgi:hypothetical protein
MNVSNLPAHVIQSVEYIINDIHASDFAENNVDVQIDMVGVLNYTNGVKLRLTFVDSFEDEDVHEWRKIARSHGASDIKTRVHTSSGNIDLNIEYKGPGKTSIPKIWMLRSVLILVASWSYHQLYLLESDRYPSPTEWFA